MRGQSSARENGEPCQQLLHNTDETSRLKGCHAFEFLFESQCSNKSPLIRYLSDSVRLSFVYKMPTLHSLVAVLATIGSLDVVNARGCPPLGPVLLAPRSPSSNDVVKRAVGELETQLKETVGNMKDSGVSIGVKSIHEKETLFSYHFSPEITSGIGADEVDADTIYRVGSISKMFPVLLALQLDIDLDASVLEFIPELSQPSGDENDLITTIQWKSISVRSLMSHMSGLPTHS